MDPKFNTRMGLFIFCLFLALTGGCGGSGGGNGADTTSPTIITKTPANDTEGVNLSPVVSAIFSADMDSDTITTSTFTLASASGSAVEAAVSYDADSLTALLMALESLSQETTYTATVAATVTDISGNPMGSAESWSFTQDYDNNLYAINSAGSHLWTYAAGEESSNVGCTTPAIGADGTIYMAGPDKTVHAVNSDDGSEKWIYDSGLGGELRTSPVVGSDGTIYIAIGFELYAISTTGTKLWNTSLPGTSDNFSSPAIATDGTLYIGGESSGGSAYVHAVNSTGVHQWRYEVDGSRDIRSSPAIGTDGTIYIGTKASTGTNAEVLALNPNGTLKWSYEIEQAQNDIYVSPAIGDDGTVYVGDEWGIIHALDGNDGTLLWQFTDSGNGAFNWSSPAIASDGTLYIGNTYGGRLTAIDTDSTGLANSAWPKFHNNNQNTGRD